jgi:hypothetical protein
MAHSPSVTQISHCGQRHQQIRRYEILGSALRRAVNQTTSSGEQGNRRG